MIKKVLIANRVKSPSGSSGPVGDGYPTVAVYSTADENCLHVRFADEQVI